MRNFKIPRLRTFQHLLLLTLFIQIVKAHEPTDYYEESEHKSEPDINLSFENVPQTENSLKSNEGTEFGEKINNWEDKPFADGPNQEEESNALNSQDLEEDSPENETGDHKDIEPGIVDPGMVETEMLETEIDPGEEITATKKSFGYTIPIYKTKYKVYAKPDHHGEGSHYPKHHGHGWGKKRRRRPRRKLKWGRRPRRYRPGRPGKNKFVYDGVKVHYKGPHYDGDGDPISHHHFTPSYRKPRGPKRHKRRRPFRKPRRKRRLRHRRRRPRPHYHDDHEPHHHHHFPEHHSSPPHHFPEHHSSPPHPFPEHHSSPPDFGHGFHDSGPVHDTGSHFDGPPSDSFSNPANIDHYEPVTPHHEHSSGDHGPHSDDGMEHSSFDNLGKSPKGFMSSFWGRPNSPSSTSEHHEGPDDHPQIHNDEPLPSYGPRHKPHRKPKPSFGPPAHDGPGFNGPEDNSNPFTNSHDDQSSQPFGPPRKPFPQPSPDFGPPQNDGPDVHDGPVGNAENFQNSHQHEYSPPPRQRPRPFRAPSPDFGPPQDIGPSFDNGPEEDRRPFADSHVDEHPLVSGPHRRPFHRPPPDIGPHQHDSPSFDHGPEDDRVNFPNSHPNKHPPIFGPHRRPFHRPPPDIGPHQHDSPSFDHGPEDDRVNFPNSHHDKHPPIFGPRRRPFRRPLPDMGPHQHDSPSFNHVPGNGPPFPNSHKDESSPLFGPRRKPFRRPRPDFSPPKYEGPGNDHNPGDHGEHFPNNQHDGPPGKPFHPQGPFDGISQNDLHRPPLHHENTEHSSNPFQKPPGLFNGPQNGPGQFNNNARPNPHFHPPNRPYSQGQKVRRPIYPTILHHHHPPDFQDHPSTNDLNKPPGYFSPPSKPYSYRPTSQRRPLNSYYQRPQGFSDRPNNLYGTQSATPTYVPPREPLVKGPRPFYVRPKEPEVVYGTPVQGPRIPSPTYPSDHPSTTYGSIVDSQKLHLPIPFKPLPNHSSDIHGINYHSNFVDQSNKPLGSPTHEKPQGMSQALINQVKHLVYKLTNSGNNATQHNIVSSHYQKPSQPLSYGNNIDSTQSNTQAQTKPYKYSTLPKFIEKFKPDPTHATLPKLTYDSIRGEASHLLRSLGKATRTNPIRSVTKFTAADAIINPKS